MLTHAHSSVRSLALTTEDRTVETVIHHARTRLIVEIDNVDDLFLDEMSIESFIDFLNKERLTSMPHRGSRWDRALRSAEYFALQISSYADLIERFTPGGLDGVNLGKEQDKALEPSFAVLYRIGLSLRFLIKHGGFFVDHAIQTEAQRAFSTLLQLVSEIALLYRAKISNISVDVIRHFLEPRDSVLKLLASDQFAARTKRAEFTCEWFQSHLLEFLRSSEQTLAITGQSGSGKTVLAGWIEERLQRPLARRSYETIEYRFVESDLPTEATSLACVKSLLLQLLQQNVGDAPFFSNLASAHATFIASGNTTQLENKLWDALHIALDVYKDGSTKLIIVIDNLDQLNSDKVAVSSFAKRIQELVNRHVCVRTIILAQSNYVANTKHTKEIHLSPSLVSDDIRRVTQDILQRNRHFEDLGVDRKREVWDQIVKKSGGSFLYAKLLIRSMHSEDGPKDFTSTIREAPKGVSEIINWSMPKEQFNHTDIKRILAWTLAAQRPLTISELSDLLRADLQHQYINDKRPDTRGTIRKRLGLILTVDSHSIVRYRHGAIRQSILDISSKGNLYPWQEAQNDLLLRLLLYTKVCVHDEEPSYDMLTLGDLHDTYRRHSLLEYAITYWLDHFRRTFMVRGESLELSSEFKAVFPSSTRMVMFEWSRWTESLTVRGALGLHDFCLRLRKEVFGEKHSIIVQSLMVLGSIRFECNQAHEAIKLMFQASQIAQAAFAQYHAVALKCSLVLLTFTDSVSDITRTEIIKFKEQTLKYVIAAYKYHEETELVIQYTKVLFQLYVQIQEDDLATRAYKELYEIIVKCYGRHSEELMEIERLMIVLEKGTKPQEIGPWTGEICALPAGNIDVIDITQIEVTIRTAEAYEAEGKLFLAEEVMVTLWARIVELSRVETSVEIQVAKIDCALAYVRFLRRLKKHEEASAILICLWAEFEHKMDSLDVETIIIRIKVVGELMKSSGLFLVAISVFSKVWNYFKRSDKTSHEVARSTTVLISEAIEEITTQQKITESKSESTTTTTTTMTSTTTQESKVTIREMFESRLSSCKSMTEHKSVLKSCSALVAVYRQERQWQQAITTIQTSLELVWRAVIIGIGMISLPETCGIEAIHTAIQLAECYVEESQLEEAEKIYVRIYQACRFSLTIEDKHLSLAVGCLISFYESIHRHERTIEVYSDIIDCYRRQLGVRHTLTIKTTYAFSRMLREYGYNRCYEYYLEIFTALNQGTDVCHYDALEAAIALLKFYKLEKRWIDLERMCETLWSAFVHNQKEYKLDLETIKLIYASYSLVLEKHIKAEFTIQRRVAMEYRETSVKYFGASASITIEASMAFASVCERHEKYQHEAISVYEEVIKKTSQSTSTVTTTTTTSSMTSMTSIFQSVKKRLTKLYVSTISSSQTTTSTTTMERAITLSMEMYRETKLQFGCWHEKTISHLHGLLIIYKKLSTKDAHEKIIKLLREIVIEVLSVEKSPWRLYSASIAIAKLFVELQIFDRGLELLNDLHSHVIAQENSSSIKLSQHYGKATYIFLVGFELTLQRTVDINYTEIMVNLISENMLFEQFKRVTEAKVKIEIVLLHGARLRQFLHLHKRHHQCRNVEKQIFQIFIDSYGSLLKTKEEASFAFFITLLEHIGKANQEVHITNAACESGVERVLVLLERGEYQHAYDMAHCVYQFTLGRGAYRDIKHVTLGISLCQYLVGKWTTGIRDEKLRQHMMELSKTAIQHILDACRDAGVNFVQLPLDILEGLVALLGSQHHYDYLEWLLKKLWSSREAQKLWPQEVIIGAGRSLVNAKFAHGHHDAHDQKGDHGHRNQAIDLCEDICYNLRRARGSTDPATLDFYKLLATLFTSTNRLEEAIRVHTDVLKFIVEGEDNDDYDPDDADDTVLRPIAVAHVRLLNTACQKLKGWGGKEREIDRLVNAVARRFGDNVLQNIERSSKWDLKKKPEQRDENDTLWLEPAVWTIRMDMEGSNKRYQPRRQITRAISNYGLGGLRKASGSTTTSMSGRVPTMASFAKEKDGVNGKQNGYANGMNGNGSVVSGVH
ncbi:MAG: hypothetical protein Q9160_005056 [Pyrenula sp. 1 TL-2023]